MKKFLIVALAAALIAGCAGTKINWDRARTVQVGMTDAQLTEIMGKPYMVTTRGDDQIWVWSYANGMTGSHGAISYTLREGKVVAVPKIPDSFK
jgi:outer membrane protein assembly factor BamE (lipoprotein component of BamABCDE complex)